MRQFHSVCYSLIASSCVLLLNSGPAAAGAVAGVTPEPTTLSMFGLGVAVAGIAFKLRKRK